MVSNRSAISSFYSFIVAPLFHYFSKTFDRLDHGILLNKLTTFVLSKSLIQLIESYLSNRKQYVFCEGSKSVEYLASSGVPQGSVHGPLLFLMFINDITEVLILTVCYSLMILRFFIISSVLKPVNALPVIY